VKKAAFSLLALTLALLILRPGALRGTPNPSPAPSGGYITGKVTSGHSNPARSLWVMVYDGANLKGQSLTGDDGRYYIGGLDDKTYTVAVRKQTSGSNLVSQSVSLPQNRVHDINLP
jgi:Carboxypeptidase regulatory-like domain